MGLHGERRERLSSWVLGPIEVGKGSEEKYPGVYPGGKGQSPMRRKTVMRDGQSVGTLAEPMVRIPWGKDPPDPAAVPVRRGQDPVRRSGSRQADRIEFGWATGHGGPAPGRGVGGQGLDDVARHRILSRNVAVPHDVPSRSIPS